MKGSSGICVLLCPKADKGLLLCTLDYRIIGHWNFVLLCPKSDKGASSERTAIPESKVPQVLCSGTKMNEP